MFVIDTFFEQPDFFRSEGEKKLILYFISRILFVVLFTYIFVKGYENRLCIIRKKQGNAYDNNIYAVIVNPPF